MSAPRVLVVDDNVDLAENVAEILDDQGFPSDVFADPKVALEALVPGRYALAILDIRMPGMDGVELYRGLKARDPALPALAMTAWSHDDRIRAALDEGMLAVLPKPLEVPKLLARLTAAIEGSRALVVEDDTALAANLAELLTERGFSVRVAHRAADARRIAVAALPAVALVDWRLPDGDGLELVEELCRMGSCTAVVFSGHSRELVDPEGKTEARGGHFLEKPLDLRRLLAIVGPVAKTT